MNFGSNNMMWILILLLILGEGNNGNSCDTLIWLLLLSRYCGDGDANFGCGCGGSNTIGRGCGV